MVPSGPPTPVGGGQQVNPSLLRSSSGLLVGQAGTLSTQPSFSSLVSPRSQYGVAGGMNMVGNMGNMANVSSLLNQSFANGGHTGIAAAGGRGMDMGGGSELDPLHGVANGFNPSFAQQSAGNPSSGVQNQHFHNPSGGQMGMDQSQQQQLESQNFLHGQQQFSRQQQQHHQQQQPLQQQQQQQQSQAQYQALCVGLGNMGAVKLEPQMSNEQNGPMRNLGSVKLEPQQLPSLRSLGPVKVEPHNSDTSILLQQQQQQQQQQLLNMSRQSPQAAANQMNILQHRLFMQQQQQLLKNIPQQRPPLSQQLQQQNLPVRNVPKPNYEPGMCARRLTHYMYHQQRRPADNSIEFWRKFVAEYFAPHAKKRWCVSMYGSGRQTTGVFPQDIWHCEICNRKPGRGFETTVEVLPRLCKIKYDSGTLEELLYVDMPHEYHNVSGQIVLDYAKAIQESVFDHLRVVREGQLRIVFSADLKICSWEFCARRHEELIPRRLIIPQVSQLGAVAQKYQTASQNSSSNLSVQDLQNNCNMFVSSARQLAKALEVPLVNDLGYTKRYVRCLQISEVVNSMKDLIDYSRETGSGPISSLINFPRRTAAASGLHGQAATTEEQQSMARNNSSNDQNNVSANNVQLSNGVVNMNNASLSTGHSTGSATTTAVTGLLHQNVLNAQENAINNANSPYGGSGTTVQIPSAGSSTSHTQSHQANPSSPFPSPTPSSTNNQQPSAAVGSPANISMQQQSQPNEVDPMDSQNAVQQMLQEIMMTSQLNGVNNMVGVGSLGSTEIKGLNGPMQPGSTILNGGPCIIGNGLNGNLGMGGGAGFSSIGGAGAVSMNMGGIRSAMASNNPMSLNGRVGLSSMAQAPNINYQNQDVGNRLLGSLGSVNSFNNLQFD